MGMIVVTDRPEMRRLLNEAGKPHYTYVLRRPDGIACHGGIGTPIYVGIGQDVRIFAHVEEARHPAIAGMKVEAIRAIWRQGGEVLHTIDGFHDREPWSREEELIRTIGQVKHGTGPLLNEQDYSRSVKINGVEVRKYADDHLDSTNNIPAKFKLREVRLAPGPNKPRSPTSVFGKIYGILEQHPGVTGEELVRLLSAVDFSDNKSAYTQSGEVCASWICGYIEGGFFRSDRLQIQPYLSPPDSNSEQLLPGAKYPQQV